jgi:hypothetical protein
MEVLPSSIHEYRYGRAARQRAALLLALACFVLILLVGMLIRSWSWLGVPTKMLGIALLITVLFTIRAQLGRLVFRCRVYPDHLYMFTPLGSRTISWKRIVEVRRLSLPQISGPKRWACAVYTLSNSGTSMPAYVFDDQLEHADAALHDVVQHTPHAQHINI